MLPSPSPSSSPSHSPSPSLLQNRQKHRGVGKKRGGGGGLWKRKKRSRRMRGRRRRGGEVEGGEGRGGGAREVWGGSRVSQAGEVEEKEEVTALNGEGEWAKKMHLRRRRRRHLQLAGRAQVKSSLFFFNQILLGQFLESTRAL